jgi:hypothetical protein
VCAVYLEFFLQIKVVLPEVTTVTSVVAPSSLTQGKYEDRFTYLDTSGRTVVTFTGYNLVADNNGIIEVLA